MTSPLTIISGCSIQLHFGQVQTVESVVSHPYPFKFGLNFVNITFIRIFHILELSCF